MPIDNEETSIIYNRSLSCYIIIMNRYIYEITKIINFIDIYRVTIRPNLEERVLIFENFLIQTFFFNNINDIYRLDATDITYIRVSQNKHDSFKFCSDKKYILILTLIIYIINIIVNQIKSL